MADEQPYLEQRLVAGEWRLGIVDDDGVWIMLRREPWPNYDGRTSSSSNTSAPSADASGTAGPASSA